MSQDALFTRPMVVFFLPGAFPGESLAYIGLVAYRLSPPESFSLFHHSILQMCASGMVFSRAAQWYFLIPYQWNHWQETINVLGLEVWPVLVVICGFLYMEVIAVQRIMQLAAKISCRESNLRSDTTK